MNNLLEDIASNQLQLYLSIIFLLIFLRLITILPSGFDVAIFSCVSLPATYASAYYRARPYKRFVVKKGKEKVEYYRFSLETETIALIISFILAYLTFVAFAGFTLEYFYIFILTFLVVQIMRFTSILLLILLGIFLKKYGIDVRHPVVTLVTSAISACFGTIILLGIYPFS